MISPPIAPMEVDRSYHPLDIELVTERYVPGILGPPDLDPLCKLREPRARAYGYASLFKLRAADKIDPKPQPPRFKDKLKALGGNARAKIHAKEGHPGFDVSIYLYGRPFIITDDDPETVATLVEKLVAESREEEIVRIFREQLEYFDVDLAREIAEFVQRRPPQPLPIAKQRALFGKIFDDRQVALRDALLSVGRPQSIPAGIAQAAREEDPDMEQRTRLNPVERFAHLASLGIGMVLAEVHPFWCHRSGLDMVNAARAVAPGINVISHDFLFGPIYEVLPEARPHATLEITAHYTSGGVIPADQVPLFLDGLKQRKDALLAATKDLDRRPERLWQKLVEAATLASRRKVGLIEGSEIRVAAEGGMP
ncbi:MAG: hypothetical protein U0166_00010 [Acidobacteriota bacterium]